MNWTQLGLAIDRRVQLSPKAKKKIAKPRRKVSKSRPIRKQAKPKPTVRNYPELDDDISDLFN